MPKMIQLRNVPDALHRKLKARAFLEGRSLSDYLLGQIRELAQRPTPAEMRERLRSRSPVTLQIPPADLIRQDRDQR